MNLPSCPFGDRRERTEDGSALVEFTWLGVLLLVPLIWVVLTLFEVQRGAFTITNAARAAGRAFVLAPDERTAHQRAEAVANQIMRDQGVTSGVSVEVTCSLGAGHCLDGTSVVTVQLRTSVPLPLAPKLFGQDTAGVGVSGEHTVPVGRYVSARGANR